ncbi:ABC transporter permease [archaeon]|jgi:putative ABC transport system permease protein|nr:ABC transporter permease [archaeon]MBT4242061.1 ABC transporter permease [archaeon]MBT4417749.1 ABC transporter permease [archaeon]
MHDYLRLAYRSLKERKIRSLLTILGIFLAIITIFVLLSLSLGLKDFVDDQFEMLGGDKFFIQPKGSATGFGGEGAVELTLDDYEVVKKIQGVDKVTYFVLGNGKIEFNEKTRYYFVLGLPEDEKEAQLVFEASGIEIEDGRWLKGSDNNKILMGYNYGYRKLMGKKIKPGDNIEINGVEFEVAGIVSEVGNPGDDQQVYINLNDFRELFNSGDRVDMLWIEIKEGEDMAEVSGRVKKKLMSFRDVDEKTIDFSILTPDEIMETFGNIFNILIAFLLGIGAISMIVGGIGIANTMYTSVLERKKEIGTMKAVGARNEDILTIFVIESGILGLVGGGAGVIVGIGIAKGIEYGAKVVFGVDMLRASMNPWIIIGSLAFAFVVGVLSGFLPSYQASKLKPVDALRYE